ncbi:MAG: 3'(2'),5'-bisphosphate nucleotidase CysQ [Trueperaceae bacterium]
MTDEELNRLAAQIADLAVEAGEKVLEIYAGDFEVQAKADASPLTQADLASERHILAGLERLTPDLPVLAEESGDIAFEQRREWHRAWLVDPLDGTKEFVKRNGEFTVNIALIEDGRPVLGVVHAPVLNVTYLASRGGGSSRRDTDGESPIRVEAPRDEELRVVMSRSHANEATQRFLQRAEQGHRVSAISQGSALKMCLVAEGKAHLYPRLGATMEWDVAAAQCVVEEAGGQLVTLDGLPMRFNRPDLVNGHFLTCYGDAGRWLELLGE